VGGRAVYIYIYVYVYMYIYLCIYIYIYIYICIYIYIYIYILYLTHVYQVLLVHEARHWEALEWAVAQEARALRRWCEAQESLFLNAASLGAARLAAGSVLELTEQVRSV